MWFHWTSNTVGSQTLICTIILLSLVATTGNARCIDVVDPGTELPNAVVTSNNIGVSYTYDLENEQYLVSWFRSGQKGGPYGPFTLTRGCAPAMVEWESNDFLLLGAGCGTFCWYALVLPLTEGIGDWAEIERPLAFDESRNLLAYYHDQNIIRVRNLMTGQQQEFRTARECESTSDLCLDAVRFTDTDLEYRWLSGENAKRFSVRLDAHRLGL